MGTNIRPIMLTPNFRLAEFLHNDDPVPPNDILGNLYCLANRLQVIRDLLGKPITINSGYRTAAHNASVGGKSDSQHLLGKAADIVIPGMTAHEVQAFLKNWNGGLGSYSNFTHVDIRPTRARWVGPG